MPSDATVDRYYYIFDSQSHRALVLDRRTGEEVVWTTVPRVQLIDYVAGERSASILRRFARWCARQAGAQAAAEDTPTGQLWMAAQQEQKDARGQARREATEAVVRAAALDLSRRRTRAARLLTVHACTHPSARQAAIDAAHMSERWAEFTTNADVEQAVQAMRQHQINWLLDALGPS